MPLPYFLIASLLDPVNDLYAPMIFALLQYTWLLTYLVTAVVALPVLLFLRYTRVLNHYTIVAFVLAAGYPVQCFATGYPTLIGVAYSFCFGWVVSVMLLNIKWE